MPTRRFCIFLTIFSVFSEQSEGHGLHGGRLGLGGGHGSHGGGLGLGGELGVHWVSFCSNLGGLNSSRLQSYFSPAQML